MLLAVLLLLAPVLISAAVQRGPAVKLEKLNGQLQAYYDGSTSTCCNSVVMLSVGTTMTVSDYSDLAENIVVQSPGVVIVIMDPNPGGLKQDGKKYANVANVIVSNITHLVPNSCCEQEPHQGYFIGGHSCGGQGMNFTVSGFIGLDPFQIDKKDMMIGIPSLN